MPVCGAPRTVCLPEPHTGGRPSILSMWWQRLYHPSAYGDHVRVGSVHRFRNSYRRLIRLRERAGAGALQWDGEGIRIVGRPP